MEEVGLREDMMGFGEAEEWEEVVVECEMMEDRVAQLWSTTGSVVK